jgi:hypothetical protein
MFKTEYGKSIIQQKADGYRSKDGYTAQSSLIAAAPVEKPSWLPAKGGLKIKSQQRSISKRPLPPVSGTEDISHDQRINCSFF